MRPPKKPKHAAPPPRRRSTGEPELDEIIETYERKPRQSLPRLLAQRAATKDERGPAPGEEPAGRKESSRRFSLDERRSEKDRARRRKRLAICGVSALIVALLAWAAYVLFYSPIFAVSAENLSVEVRDDAGIIDDAEITALARAQVGTPVLRVDAGSLERALEELPEVAEASVEASFPSTLAVRVTANIPIACIGIPGSCTPVLADGTEVTSVTEEAAAALPVVSMTLGDETSARLQGLLDAVAALPEDLRVAVTAASISDTGLIEFSLSEATVKWGESADNEKKARVLAVLLTTPAGTYDVSTPDSPVTY